MCSGRFWGGYWIVMKIRQSFGKLLVSSLVTVCAVYQSNRACAQVDLSLNVNIQSPSDLYRPLAQYGGWVNVPQYGLCWRASEVPPDWRPYTIGHWEWTDAGWYWVSDEPWAWACYHYGQWVLDPVYGWVWLPGTQWAPAWVTWREAPDYIGWAPCGPSGAVLAATPFCFVDIHRFHDRLRPSEFVFNNPQILRRSRVVGGFQNETRDWGGERRRIVVNKGPDVAPIERATGSRFVQRPVREVARQASPATGRNPGTFTRQPTAPNRQRTGAANENANSSRIYREPQAVQPTPTGREEPRLYHQAPATPATSPSTPAPQPSRQVAPPAETPRQHQQLPREPRTTTTPAQQPNYTPSPSARSERAQPPAEVHRRIEQSRPSVEPARPQPQAPRAVPAPPVAAPPATAPVPRDEGRRRDRDGQ